MDDQKVLPCEPGLFKLDEWLVISKKWDCGTDPGFICSVRFVSRLGSAGIPSLILTNQ